MEGQDGKFDKLQVNEIDSPLTIPVIVTPILRYDAPKLFTDPQDIPDKQYVDAGIISNDPILIHAGDPWPANLVRGVDFVTNSLYPLVLQVVAGATSTQDTNEGASQLCRYNFTDNTKTVLASIDVLTTTSDGTTVDVDTWVRVI